MMKKSVEERKEIFKLVRNSVAAMAFWGILLLLVYRWLRRNPDWIGLVLVLVWLLLSALVIVGMGFLPRFTRGLQLVHDEELNRAQQMVQEMQIQKQKEQLNALQSQINPHFLYNTLDTIRGLALEVEDTKVAAMVGTLSAMFRYSMDYEDSIVSVADEMNHLNSFLKIQSIRFPNRFDVETLFDCDMACLNQVKMPKMVLQPIVENIFTHGLKEVTSGGKIVLHLLADDDCFRMIISDNGKGIKDAEVLAINQIFLRNASGESRIPAYDKYGIALKNIDARVKMNFGEEYGLHLVSTWHFGTEVTLSLPMPREAL